MRGAVSGVMGNKDSAELWLIILRLGYYADNSLATSDMRNQAIYNNYCYRTSVTLPTPYDV